jgi:hypothetical protein
LEIDITSRLILYWKRLHIDKLREGQIYYGLKAFLEGNDLEQRQFPDIVSTI